MINNLALVDGKLAYSILVDGEESIVLDDEVVAGPFPKTEYSRPVREIAGVGDELFYALNRDQQIFFCYQGKETPFDRSAGNYQEQLIKVIDGEK